jgi:hypothetical protein
MMRALKTWKMVLFALTALNLSMAALCVWKRAWVDVLASFLWTLNCVVSAGMIRREQLRDKRLAAQIAEEITKLGGDPTIVVAEARPDKLKAWLN